MCLFVGLIHVKCLQFIRVRPYHIRAVHGRLCTVLTHGSNINEMFLSAVSRSGCQKLQPADTDDGAQQCVHVWWRKTGSQIRATTFCSGFFFFSGAVLALMCPLCWHRRADWDETVGKYSNKIRNVVWWWVGHWEMVGWRRRKVPALQFGFIRKRDEEHLSTLHYLVRQLCKLIKMSFK